MRVNWKTAAINVTVLKETGLAQSNGNSYISLLNKRIAFIFKVIVWNMTMKYGQIEKSCCNTINSVWFRFVLQGSRHDPLAVHFIFELSLVLYRYSHLLLFGLCVLDLSLSRFPSIASPLLSIMLRSSLSCLSVWFIPLCFLTV